MRALRCRKSFFSHFPIPSIGECPAVSVNKWFPGLQRRPGARLQLFCFPFAGGGASAFRGWQNLLPPWMEVWPLEYPGHETRFREPSFDSASGLTAAISTELAAAIDRPFALFGHSMGALLVFETAAGLSPPIGETTCGALRCRTRQPPTPTPPPAGQISARSAISRSVAAIWRYRR